MDLALRIVNHCAPALAGIKPSNLISCPSATCCDACTYMDYLNAQLNDADIYFRCVSRQESLKLFLVYRRDKLERHLAQGEVKAELMKHGYIVDQGLERMLQTLEEKLESAHFPHEIGYFLGYPVADVKAYIEQVGKNSSLSGYWQVYDQPEAARKAFQRYTTCRESLLRLVKSGRKIEDLFKPRRIAKMQPGLYASAEAV